MSEFLYCRLPPLNGDMLNVIKRPYGLIGLYMEAAGLVVYFIYVAWARVVSYMVCFLSLYFSVCVLLLQLLTMSWGHVLLPLLFLCMLLWQGHSCVTR